MNIPTRWRTTFEEQLGAAERRVSMAQRFVAEGRGGRALQEAYPAVVTAASLQVWRAEPPWQRPLPTDELQRRVREMLPNLFAALAEQDVQQVLTSPWRPEDARPYVEEAERYLATTRQELDSWLARD